VASLIFQVPIVKEEKIYFKRFY